MKIINKNKNKNTKTKTEHILIAKKFKGWTYKNKSKTLIIQDGNKLHKYKNVIYESLKEEYKKNSGKGNPLFS